MSSISMYFTFWAVGISVIWLAALRLALSPRRRRYPLLLTFLAFNAVSSVLLFTARHAPRDYIARYVLFGCIMAVLEFGGLIEAFRGLIEHYRNFRAIAVGMFAVIVTGSILLVLATSGVGTSGDWDGFAADFVRLARYVNLGFCATLVALVLVLPKSPAVPINPGAVMNAGIWITRFVLSLSAYAIMEFTSAKANMLASWITAAGMILCGAAWIVAMSKRFDYTPKRMAISEEAIEQFKRETRKLDGRLGWITRRCKL